MVDYILSPDEKFCWCTSDDIPYHFKERWIPIEEIKTYQKNMEERSTRSRDCPLCWGSKIEFEEEIDVGVYGYCDDCDAIDHFIVTKLEPLTVEGMKRDLYKYWMPMRIPSQLSEKGLEFELFGEDTSFVTSEQLNDVIWAAYNQAKNDLYEAYCEATLDEDWWDDSELIETQNEEFILDESIDESE